MSFFSFYRLGEAGLVCCAPPPAGLRTQERIWQLASQIKNWPDVLEIIPGMNNLTLIFNPEQVDVNHLQQRFVRAAQRSASATAGTTGRLIEIPVHYGGEDGCDLEALAVHAGLSTSEVIQLHSSAEYIVYFTGFQAGFAYLGGLNSRLYMPRRANPRLTVLPGSVAIGGTQTGIYPTATPGGWNLIGRCFRCLFDPEKDPPALLQAGDRLRFIPVDHD